VEEKSYLRKYNLTVTGLTHLEVNTKVKTVFLRGKDCCKYNNNTCRKKL